MAAFKPPFLAFFLAALAFLAQVTLCLEIKVTGTSNGQPIDPASIVLDANPPRLHSPPSRRASPGGATAEPLEKRQIYSDDWCGAISSTPTTNKITNVQGYFQVPTPSLLVDGDYPQYVGAWIGIDGVTWGSSLLQAGTTSAIAPGEVDYWAWFQWYPSPAYSLPNFAVSPGDWIYVSITPSSATAAILTIMNYSNQLNYTFELSDGDALGQQDADWVIEDPYNITSQTNLPAFGTVWFEDVYATTENGSYLDASTATYSWLDYPPLCESTKYDAYDFYAQWSGNG